MSFSLQSFYICLWALTPLVSSLATGYTIYPNQIYVGYELLLVFFALLIFRNSPQIIAAQAKWLTLLSLYALTFIAVSYGGVDFTTSIQYGVLYLPLILLGFFISFSIGYMFHERRTFKYIMAIAVILMLYGLIDIYISPDRSRFVTALDIPNAIPLFVFFGHTLLALAAVLFLFLSLKKTVIGAGVLSFVMAYLLKRYVGARTAVIRRFYSRRALLTGYAKAFLVLVFVGVIVTHYLPYLLATMARFVADQDETRLRIFLYSFGLLTDYFPRGIGLGGFSFLSMEVIPYEVTTAHGDVVRGANLHNSYMTWALEGGAPILLIVVTLFWKLLRVIHRFLRNEETRVLGAVLLIWLLSGMAYGMFQQWHNTGTFWTLFGFAFGCHERYRRLWVIYRRQFGNEAVSAT